MMMEPDGFTWDGFENHDGTINTQHASFQQGRTLYDAQCLVADIDAGKTPDPALVRKVCVETCRLINAVGQLRAYYNGDLEKRAGFLAELRRLIDRALGRK